MKINSLEIKNFKRFTNLKIEIDKPKARIVVVVGPNGSGKSSIFDAFEQIGGRQKANFGEDATYLKKDQSKEWTVIIGCEKGTFSKGNPPPRNHFYLRSSYRYDPDFQINAIQKKDEILASLMTGTSNVSLEQDDLYDLEIPLPDIKEQNEFVNKQEELEIKVKKLQKEIEEMELIVDSKTLNFWGE